MLDSTKLIFTKHARDRWIERISKDACKVTLEESVRSTTPLIRTHRKLLFRFLAKIRNGHGEDSLRKRMNRQALFYDRKNKAIWVAEPDGVGRFKLVTCFSLKQIEEFEHAGIQSHGRSPEASQGC